MKALRDALGAWAPQRASGWESEPVALLAAAWPEIVGNDVARHCAPLRLRGGTLTVVTRSNAWNHQLSFFAERMLAAVRARLERTTVERLQFCIGRLPKSPAAPPRAQPGTAAPRRHSDPVTAAQPTSTAQEAVERFRGSVEANKRAKTAAGWKQCRQCGAAVAPRAAGLCVACRNARDKAMEAQTSRLLFEAPWLGYEATAELVQDLTWPQYRAIRVRLLARWWETLRRAKAAKRLSRDGRERLIASSYVVLKSKLAPEEIEPATIRNVLGDELHDLIYETETQTNTDG